jgi:type IV pilus assembly protein PilM
MEIGSSMTRICEVDYKVKNPRIHQCFMMETPAGVMSDGVLKMTPEYVREIKNKISQNKIKAKQVIFSMTSTKIASREILIPKVKESRIGTLVEANASDYFPVDLSEYELAHSVLDTVRESVETEKYKVLVLAASKSMVEGYEKLADALGLNMIAVDYGGNSLYQMVQNQCTEGMQMVVKVDESTSFIEILDDGKLIMQRTVSSGINEMVEEYKNKVAMHYDYEAVLNALGEENYFEHSTLNEGEEATPEFTTRNELTDQLSDAFSYTLQGIVRIFDYQNSRNTQKPISKVFLTGLGAGIKGLDGFMEERMGVPVARLSFGSIYQFDKNQSKDKADGYIACLGAPLSPVGFSAGAGEKKVKDKDDSKAGAASPYAVSILAGCVVLSVIVAAVALVPYYFSYVANRQKRVKLEDLSYVVPIYEEYVTAKNADYYLQAAYEATEYPTDTLLELIQELEKKLPQGVYMSTFAADKEGVTFNVTAETKQQAVDTLIQMRTIESLVNVKVNNITDTNDEETDGQVTFTVTADYVNAKQDTTTAAAVDTSSGVGEAETIDIEE